MPAALFDQYPTLRIGLFYNVPAAQHMNTVVCENLDDAIEQYKQLGYRLDMIKPADAPREALMSRDGESVRLVRSSGFSQPRAQDLPPEGGTPNQWITGRAGMEYRDLIPDRLGGKLIASHIRLTKGGVVPDYVHYHKVDFQMIYCVKGRIKVVYEDQGEPFWLETGDCVLQPPEIRHRVLECTAGAEVIEVSMPAEHETWVEHEIQLPTSVLNTNRVFNHQRFVHHVANDIDDGIRDTGIATATSGSADVKIVRENGVDAKLLLTFRILFTEIDGSLSTPVALEIAI